MNKKKTARGRKSSTNQHYVDRATRLRLSAADLDRIAKRDVPAIRRGMKDAMAGRGHKVRSDEIPRRRK